MELSYDHTMLTMRNLGLLSWLNIGMLINIFILDMIFDVCGTFPLSNVRIGKNIIIFDANLSSSVYVDNEKKIS